MINIKISADNERLLNGAKTEGELRGAVDMVLERIAQSKAVRTATQRELAEPKKPNPFNWKEVLSAMRDSLGDDVTCPPYPDPIWYQNINRRAKMYALNREGCYKLAEMVKESYLKPPFQLSFLLNNAEAILAGRYAKDNPNSQYGQLRAPRRTPLPSLPED